MTPTWMALPRYAIYTYHAVSLGWGDIGYSSLIDRDGYICEDCHGRGAGETREVLSADVVAVTR